MIDHLSTHGRLDYGKGSIVSSVQTKLNPSYWHIWCIKNHQKQIGIEKVTTPKVEGVKKLKKQITKHYKANS
jgi:hypothetical protein